MPAMDGLFQVYIDLHGNNYNDKLCIRDFKMKRVNHFEYSWNLKIGNEPGLWIDNHLQQMPGMFLR